MNAIVRPSDVTEVLIPLDLIDPDPNLPRQKFDEAELESLGDSIVADGLKQAIRVRPNGDRFTIIFGERRWRAHKRKKLHEIRATIETRQLSHADILVEQIIENDQRADVRPIDEARKFKELVNDGMPIDELASRIGRQVWRVEERLRLLDLDHTILKLYESGNLPQEAASEISRIKDHAQQAKLVRMVSLGQLRGYKAIRAAVDTILGAVTASDLFGDSAPKASEEDMRTLNRMEAKIEQVVGMVASGWKDGECIIATKVSPDRARLMAEKLAHLRKAIFIMESELRATAAQGAIVLEEVA